MASASLVMISQISEKCSFNFADGIVRPLFYDSGSETNGGTFHGKANQAGYALSPPHAEAGRADSSRPVRRREKRHALLPRPPLHSRVYGAESEALRLTRYTPLTGSPGNAPGEPVRSGLFRLLLQQGRRRDDSQY